MKVTGDQAIAFKENEELYKRMNKGIEKKIAAKEEEIKNLDALYDKKTAISRLQGEDEYQQSLERNGQRILSESNIFENKIKSYQDKLKKVQDTVASEEVTLKTSGKQKMAELKGQMEESFLDQYSTTQDNQRVISESTQASVKEIAARSKAEKLLMEGNAKYEINALSSEFNQKAADNEKNYRSKLDNDIRLHTSDINLQKEQLKKLMTMDAEKNKRLSNEQNRVNKDALDFQEKHQQDMLLQRDKDFKVRYENLVKEHDSVLKTLSDKFVADARKLTESTASDKRILGSRSEDPFYRVDTLNPKLKEELKFVTVTLPVAEYEKENVHLSTQGRTIKITLSRKYTDTLNAEDGTVNRSTKSELFSKELAATDLLSPKGVTQAYADGVMTFRINKA